MIRLYFHSGPNPIKVALYLEESGLPYEIVPIDINKGDQHTPEFVALNPNAKVPVIVDTDSSNGKSVTVFDSTAILLYLGKKTEKFIGSEDEQAQLLSWLLFIATGIGPFSGQVVHFQNYAPEKIPYALNRYQRELKRHYQVLNDHLVGQKYIINDDYTIADMSAWGWISKNSFIFPEENDPLESFPELKRWLQSINDRDAVKRVAEIIKKYSFKTEQDEESRRAMFPSNYPQNQ